MSDLAVFEFFGSKYTELINGQNVVPVFGRGGPPRYGAIWGVMIGWAYDHYGIFSWVPDAWRRVGRMDPLYWFPQWHLNRRGLQVGFRFRHIWQKCF